MIAFLVAYLAITLFGLPFVFHPSLRHLDVATRVAIAFCAGAIALTTWAIFLALFHIPWSGLALSLPLLASSVALSWFWVRRGKATSRARQPFALPPILILAASALAVIVALDGTSKSTDLLLFWGVKAVRFAAAQGFEPDFLRWPYALHTHTNYPPLWPVTLAFATLFSDTDAMWTLAPPISVVWILAASLSAFGILATTMPRKLAAAATTFWAIAMYSAIDASESFGNAEAMLVAFTTIAVAATIAENDPSARTLLAISLSGLCVTKLEGIIAAVLIMIGIVLRDSRRRDRENLFLALKTAIAPAAIGSLWWIYLAVNKLPLNDATREPLLQISFDQVGVIVKEMLRNMNAGAAWLPWLVPVALLAFGIRRITLTMVPAFVLASGLGAFFFFYYLHGGVHTQLIIYWTWSRTSLTILSALMIAAGAVTSVSHKPFQKVP